MTIEKPTKQHEFRFPIFVERNEEEDHFMVECPGLPDCNSKGRTLDEALKNIHEVIESISELK